MQRVYEENEWGKVSKRIITTGVLHERLHFSQPVRRGRGLNGPKILMELTIKNGITFAHPTSAILNLMTAKARFTIHTAPMKNTKKTALYRISSNLL